LDIICRLEWILFARFRVCGAGDAGRTGWVLVLCEWQFCNFSFDLIGADLNLYGLFFGFIFSFVLSSFVL
jgi:hypothetical protein